MFSKLLQSLFLTFVLTLCTAGATPTWTELFPTTSPPARSYLAMAYDAASHKVVMFGGFGEAGYLNDTWTFDGTTWKNANTGPAPSPRTNMQMAYDRATRKVVLFGGYDGRRYLGDTWLWDGTTSTWTQASPLHSPQAVAGPMVFNDLGGRVDTMGGFDGQFYQNTMWQWSGRDWRKLHPSSVPSARSSAAVGVDYRSHEIVLYGGLADVNPLNTWTYDGATWTQESPTIQPLTVYAASGVYDASLNSVLVFGGGDGGVDQNRTWSWTGSNWEQLSTVGVPGPREGAGMVYDVALGRTILFGGQNSEVPVGDTWELQSL